MKPAILSMKPTFLTVRTSMIAAFLWGATALYGQIPVGECGGPTAVTYTCKCGTYSGHPSGGNTDSWSYYVSNRCCGQTTYVANDLGGCPSSSLYRPDTRTALAALASDGVPLLVRVCSGHFIRYGAPPSASLNLSAFDKVTVPTGE